jgi:ABC-type dipeptide/oligopeptide/nickel transport system permease subunit
MVAEGRELTASGGSRRSRGVAILMVALAANLVGDGLRDAIDPRLRLR